MIPSLRFVLAHPAHVIAFGFGSGLIRPAPGTAGTLVAFPIFWALSPRMSDGAFALLLLVSFWVGVWACGRTGRALGVHDHGGIVVDEIVAFLAVLFMIPHTLVWQAGGFLLFRFFDILKPVPIRYYDRTLKGGLGVMFDDLLAALYALLVLAVFRMVVHGS
ncbi:MAG: phosphatidylglycerophosphatase A [Betaproteobacteria bacterium]|nr:phosphatidylglycerophosphatase A [Betaproteobacteria bacterium]